jgi:UVSSA N-terminal domain
MDAVRAAVLSAVGITQLESARQQQSLIRKGQRQKKRRRRGSGPTTVIHRNEILQSATEAPVPGSQLALALQNARQHGDGPQDGDGSEDVLDSSGNLTLMVSKQLIRDVTASVRSSNTAVKLAFELLLPLLRDPKDARVRYRALSVVDALFLRSSYFRSLMIPRLPTFVDACAGVEHPLPPPDNVAALLLDRTTRILARWHALHGVKHREIGLAEEFLLSGRQRGRQRMHTELHAQRLLGEQQQEERIVRAQFRNIVRDLEPLENDLRAILREMRAAFEILVPTVDPPPDADALDEAGLDDAAKAARKRKAEVLSDDEDFSQAATPFAAQGNVELASSVGALENAETDVLFDTLRGLLQEISTHAATLHGWYNVVLRTEPSEPATESDGGDGVSRSEKERVLRQLVELREQIKESTERCAALNITAVRTSGEVIPVAADTTFEDRSTGVTLSVVPVDTAPGESSSETASAAAAEEVPIARRQQQQQEERNPTTSRASDRPRIPDGVAEYTPYFNREDDFAQTPAEPTAALSADEMRAKAPFVPFFGGLASWGQSEVMVPTTTREHRFLGSGTGETTMNIDKTDVKLFTAVYTKKPTRANSDGPSNAALAIRRRQEANMGPSSSSSGGNVRERLSRHVSDTRPRLDQE